MFQKHPPALKFLFFTELWERFGFYLMIGIFFFYMTDKTTGGLGFSDSKAFTISGTYTALVYLTPFFGGIVADRLLGYRKSVLIGGTLMAAGYLGLALPGTTAFYVALGLIVLGNGFFKPNISTMVGRLYPEGSPLKDSGYNIFYMGINIGAFFCNFVAAYLRNTYESPTGRGWALAFSAAGIGMLIGLVTFLAGQKTLRGVQDRGEGGAVDSRDLGVLVGLLVLAGLCGALGYWLGGDLWAFLLAALPLVAYFLNLWLFRSRPEERGPIGALLSIFVVAIVFWAIYYQNQSSLSAWAERNTWREAGSLTPALKLFSLHQDATIGTTIKDPDAEASYWKNVPVAQRPAPGQEVALYSPELFQSVNPLFIVVLTPLVLGFFSWLARRKKEPSTPAKLSWGMVVTALSALVMVAAVAVAQGGAAKASAWWLIGTYFVVTVAELCLSPMGLALTSKLAPKRFTALLMGGWFLSTSFGGKLSGVIADATTKYSLSAVWWMNCAMALAAAGGIALLVPWIRRVMQEQEARRA